MISNGDVHRALGSSPSRAERRPENEHTTGLIQADFAARSGAGRTIAEATTGDGGRVRIGINALLLTGRPGYRQTGLNRYVASLLDHLPAADPTIEWRAFVASDAPPTTGVASVVAPVPAHLPVVRIGWEWCGLPVATRRAGLDLFHGTMNAIPAALPCPAVVTVHDLAFLKFPENVTRRRYHYLRWATGHAVRSARRVIAVSRATKHDLIEQFDIPEERIDVTPLGVDARFRPAGEEAVESLVRRLGLRRPFVLSVGTLEPRKNLPALLRAFDCVAPEVPHNLVLAGATGWRRDELNRTRAKLNLGDRLQLTGFVPDADLPALYSAAAMFAFPSLYEGFGLPVLEAMACGTPVLTGADSSLPEVAGDAALLVDPRDVDTIAVGMRSLLTDDALSGSLAAAGRHRAATFSWTRTAELTIASYRKALA